MTVSNLRAQFLEGMSRAAATVNVVTTDGPAGRAGVTVSAMSSVSADGDGAGSGPMMLVCVNHRSSTAQTILENGCFCANILRDDQSDISERFAGRIKAPSKFDGAEWQVMPTGAPRVIDPLAAFDCKVISGERVGTHHIFIGEVQDVFVAESGSPLVFANRAYGATVALGPGPEGRKATGRLSVGALHTIGPYILPRVLHDLVTDIGQIDLDIHEGDQETLLRKLRAGEIDLAFLYDMALGTGMRAEPITTLTPYVLLAEADPLAAEESLTLAALATHPLILLDTTPSRAFFLGLFEGIASPRIGYRVQTFEMVRGLVGAGLGYGLLATKPSAAMSYDGSSVVTRPLSDTVAETPLALVQRMDATPSPLAKTFITQCARTFGLPED